MRTRLAWIGCTLAAGLLLQIALQIRALHWLPDFPIYLALAILAAAVAVPAAPLAVIRRPWLVWISSASFLVLAVVHAVLAIMSSSTAMEWWRDLILWPALAAGIVLSLPLSRSWPASARTIWSLGEGGASLLACGYAPSFGETHSLRAYEYVLFSGVITMLVAGSHVWQQRKRSLAWVHATVLIGPTAIMLLLCLILPDPANAQSALMLLAALRILLLAGVEYALYPGDAKQSGEDNLSSPA
jgi:hypothetical protein